MKKREAKKKIVSLVTTLALTVSMMGTYFVVLGGTVVKSKDLLNAEKATYAIFDYERKKLYEKSEEQEAMSGTFHVDELKEVSDRVSAYDIKGLDESEDYILVTATKGDGYAIYSKDNLELLEFSPYAISPYSGVDKDKAYYGGPMNYIEKTNGVLKNIDTGEIVTAEKANDLMISLKGVELNIKQERIDEKQKEELIFQTDESAASIQSATVGDIIEKDQMTNVSSQKLITDYRYFTLNPYHHNNNDPNHGTCMPVAMQLLMGYCNWSQDGRIIKEKSFLSGRDKSNNVTLDDPYSYDSISTTEAFFSRIHEFVGEHILGDLHIYAVSAFNKYLKEYVETSVAGQISYWYNYQDVNSLINHINQGRPVMASFRMGVANYHMIVVYGYQTIVIEGVDQQGYIGHFGWSSNKNYAWLNKAFFNGYVYFYSTHIHSDEMFNSDEHIVRCSECNRIKYNNQHMFGYRYEKIEYEQIKDTDQFDHRIYCRCGEYLIRSHNLRYVQSDAQNHRAICSPCGYSAARSHFYKNGRQCFYCYYERAD